MINERKKCLNSASINLCRKKMDLSSKIIVFKFFVCLFIGFFLHFKELCNGNTPKFNLHEKL